jgi:hypothetical protein
MGEKSTMKSNKNLFLARRQRIVRRVCAMDGGNFFTAGSENHVENKNKK